MAWAPDYITLDDLKDFLRIPDMLDDTQLGILTSTVSRNVDRYTGRQFGVVALAESRVYKPYFDRRETVYRAEIDDLMTRDGLIVLADGTPLGSTEYEFLPYNAEQKQRPWTSITLRRSVTTLTVTALWGWANVPDGVRKASLLQASRLAIRRNSPLGVAGSPDEGSELRLLSRLDPDVEVVLGPFKRWDGV